MLEVLTNMRQLVAKSLWYAKVATMSMDDNGDVDVSDILLVAALTYTTEACALTIGLSLPDVITNMPEKHWASTRDYTLDVIDALIANERKKN